MEFDRKVECLPPYLDSAQYPLSMPERLKLGLSCWSVGDECLSPLDTQWKEDRHTYAVLGEATLSRRFLRGRECY